VTTLGAGADDVASTGACVDAEMVDPPAVPDGCGPSAMYPKSAFAALPQNSGG